MSRTGIYASAKGAILGQTLSLLDAGIKAMPLNSGYTPDYANHTVLSDVLVGNRVTAGVALTSKTLVQVGTGYKYDADDVVFTGVPNPSTIAGVLLYLDTGTESTSKLIGYFDYFVGVPVTVTTGTVTFTWPAYAIFVLDDGVLGGPQGVPGGLGFTPPTGTGFMHVTGGVLDAASKKVDLTDTADVTAPGTAGQIQTKDASGGLAAPGPYAGADYISLIAGTPDVPGVRIANNTTFAGQNFAGTADIITCYVDSTNNVRIGSAFDATQTGILFAVPSGGSHKFSYEFGSTVYGYLSETEQGIVVPRHGYTAPYASEGEAPFAVVSTSHTLTPTEYTRQIIKFTGTLGGTSTITFPLPSIADNSYCKSIRNTSTSSLVLTNGGTTYTVAAGTNAEIFVTTDGIFGVTTGGGGSSSAGSAGQIQGGDGAGGFTAPGPYIGAAYVTIISGTPTTSGFRMGNAHALSARNGAGTADLKVCYTDSSNNVYLGDNSANQTNTYIRAPNGASIYLSIAGNLTVTIGNTLTTHPNPIALGNASPYAVAGWVRLGNNPGTIVATRNAANTADQVAMASAAAELTIGCNVSYTENYTNIRMYGVSTVVIGLSGANYFVALAGVGCRCDQPLKLFSTLGGYQSALKYAYTDLSFSGTDITLSSSQQETPILKCNNASGNIIAPDTRGSTYIVDNTGSTVARTIKKPAGTGVSCPASKTTTVYHNGTDYAVQSQF